MSSLLTTEYLLDYCGNRADVLRFIQPLLLMHNRLVNENHNNDFNIFVIRLWAQQGTIVEN